MTKPTTERKIIVDLDGNIKEAIDSFFEDWLIFFFPNLHPLVDFLIPPIPLEQEFQGIIAFASGKKKIVDKLYQITMKPVVKTTERNKGSKKKEQKPVKEIVLLHTEAETSPKSTFTRRVFLYAAVAIAKYQRRLTALVIYTGKKVPKKRNSFEMFFQGTLLSYIFNTYVVAEQNEEELIASDNIFALIILAIKYVIDSPNDYAKRFAFKKKLFSLLLEREYPLEKRRKLMIFVNQILSIPKDLQDDFIKFAYTEVHNSMKTKKIDNSVKAGLKQSEKEWADAFAELFYGAPVEVLLEKNTASVTSAVTSAVTKSVTADVTSKVTAAERELAQKKTRGIVLHLYHTIGLTVNQIAETVDLKSADIEAIINGK
jgi:hypothetical protein